MEHSLRAHTKHDMVLMYLVGNCSSWITSSLRRNSTQLAASHMFSQNSTVIVLDTDVLIRNDMDELFEREAPAAVRRQHQGKYLD